MQQTASTEEAWDKPEPLNRGLQKVDSLYALFSPVPGKPHWQSASLTTLVSFIRQIQLQET